ncbi:MAG: CHASE2 domain-containing protein [Anaerolineae bacterium]
MARRLARLNPQPIRIGIVTGSIVALLLLGMWKSELFTRTQLRLNDVYFVPSSTENNVVIVGLDDASLTQYGRSLTNWPRSVYAQLIDVISKGGARVIAFDVWFDEATNFDTLITETIAAARQSPNRVRFVMPLIGATVVENPDQTAPSISFGTVLKPAKIIREAADYLGYVNTFADVDSAVRRQPSLLVSEGQTNLSFAISTYLAYLRVPAAAIDQIVVPSANALQVASLSIPVDEHGVWLQNFFGPPANATKQTFPIYSARAINDGAVASSVFKDKVVLVGLINATGGTDMYAVPSSTNGQLMAGVEIHANAIQSLISNKIPSEQSQQSQILMIVALSLASSLVYAHLRWFMKMPVSVLLVAATIFVAFMLFSTHLEAVNLFFALLALVVPYTFNQIVDIAREINRRLSAEFLLQSMAQISQQQMEIERILPSLSQDVRRLFNARNGAIWLPAAVSGKLNLQHHWGQGTAIMSRFESLAKWVHEERQLIQNGDIVAAPVMWQQQVIAIVTVQMPQQIIPFRAGQIKQLTNLTQEVVPVWLTPCFIPRHNSKMVY